MAVPAYAVKLDRLFHPKKTIEQCSAYDVTACCGGEEEVITRTASC